MVKGLECWLGPGIRTDKGSELGPELEQFTWHISCLGVGSVRV